MIHSIPPNKNPKGRKPRVYIKSLAKDLIKDIDSIMTEEYKLATKEDVQAAWGDCRETIAKSLKLRKKHMKRIGLCHRCEYRATFMDDYENAKIDDRNVSPMDIPAPRCECHDIGKSVGCCYMFRPCRPLVLSRANNDKRPMLGPSLLSARMVAIRIDEGELRAGCTANGNIVMWSEPRRDEWPAPSLEKSQRKRGVQKRRSTK